MYVQCTLVFTDDMTCWITMRETNCKMHRKIYLNILKITQFMIAMRRMQRYINLNRLTSAIKQVILSLESIIGLTHIQWDHRNRCCSLNRSCFSSRSNPVAVNQYIDWHALAISRYASERELFIKGIYMVAMKGRWCVSLSQHQILRERKRNFNLGYTASDVAIDSLQSKGNKEPD